MLEFIEFWKNVVLSLHFSLPLGKNYTANVSVFGLIIASFSLLIVISVIYALLSYNTSD